MDVGCQLNGRDSLLVAGDEIHRNEPLAEGNLRVLEDSPDKNGEIRLAVGAMEPPVGAGNAMVLAAERANHIILLPTGLKYSLTASFFGIEVRGKFINAIEMTKVYHKSQV